MRTISRLLVVPGVALFFALILGCPLGGGGDSKSGSGGEDNCLGCQDNDPTFLHLDSENVAALLSMDQNTIGSSSLSMLKNQSSGDATSPSPLQGILENGEVLDALRCFRQQTGIAFDRESGEGLDADCWDSIPRIVTVAECDSYIYLVFERPFVVRTETPDGVKITDYEDPWSPSSPFTSQLLRTSVPITNYSAGDRLERGNLQGVLFGMEVNTWDRRRNIQFDGSCNLYVTAHVPGTSEDVLIKIKPDAAENEYDEVVNANICYERYLITSGGDCHYTGRTSSGGECSGGDSFYRMVSSAGVLTEITRDWWDYKFEPLSDGTVVFYGPEPDTGVASWDSACLFKFDGSKSGSARYTKLVNCVNDWNKYRTEGPASDFKTSANDTELERCTEQFYTYRGSNAPEAILSFDRNGDGTKEIFTVSDAEQKQKGTWKCDICIDSNTGHCENSSGVLTGDITEAACTAASGTWGTSAECYNGVSNSACTITQPTGWKLNHTWCQDPGTNWSKSYSALSAVKSDKTVELISSTDETVTNAWVAGNRIVYNSVKGGTYSLKGVTFNSSGTPTVTELVSGIEMYEVAKDPTTGVDRLLVNGLRFSDNSYVFGTYDFGGAGLAVNSSLTGLVETMLIVGN